MRAILILLIISCLFINQNSYSQISLLNQERSLYARIAEDTIQFRTFQSGISYNSGNYFNFLELEMASSLNTTYSRSFNDGPIWKGKGLTNELWFGFQFKEKAFNVTFFPSLFWSQNRTFDLAQVGNGSNPYNYQFAFGRGIDFVQRYGDDSFYKFNLGQTEIAFRKRYLQAAIGFNNFTLGPSSHHSILMSNNGGGFPHINLGTNEILPLRYKSTDLGGLELQLIYGLLKESDFFDTLSTNDRRYFNALSMGYSIPYYRNLTIGFHKALYKNAEYFDHKDLYSMFYIADESVVIENGDTLINTNDAYDQLASVFVNWDFPENDFRIFFEFARNDFNGSFRRLLQEFEHSRAYSLGFDKVFSLAKSDFHISYEHTFLARYQSYLYRANPPYYSHHLVRQGYTHDGQLLGAGVGPGAVTDFINLNWVRNDGFAGVNLQRIRFNEDYFFLAVPNNLEKINKHDVEYTLGFKWYKRNEKVGYGFDSKLSYRFSMYFRPDNDRVNLYGKVYLKYFLDQEKRMQFR